jgi:hypothetical protein
MLSLFSMADEVDVGRQAQCPQFSASFSHWETSKVSTMFTVMSTVPDSIGVGAPAIRASAIAYC